MNSKDDPRGILKKGIPSSTNEISSLKQQMVEMQLEIDILKETINVLKKDPGVSKAPLKNKEKAAIVDALKDQYTLPMILRKLEMPKAVTIIKKPGLIVSINISNCGNRSMLLTMITELAMVIGGFTPCSKRMSSQSLKK